MSRACRFHHRAAACAMVLALVLSLLPGCGGGDADPDAELRAWCDSFIGPLNQQQQAECDRVRGGS